jgi:hypothetical protein
MPVTRADRYQISVISEGVGGYEARGEAPKEHPEPAYPATGARPGTRPEHTGPTAIIQDIV